MKKLRIFLWMGLIPFLIYFSGCGSKKQVTLDPSGFTTPPDSARIYTWWHWMVNAISREGITRDLEAMKEQGIAGATILNVGGILEEKDYGVTPVIFGSEAWFDMFKWALQEADRLDLKIGAHNCDGWSTSGGPWITPDMSMKTLVWSQTFLTGGLHVDTTLLKPSGKLGFYNDVAVIAYPANRAPSSFQLAQPEIFTGGRSGRSLYDGSPVSGLEISKGDRIRIDFRENFRAAKLSIHPRVVFSWSDVQSITCEFRLSASRDGKNFRTVKSFTTTGANRNHAMEIPPVSARYYMLELVDASERSVEITEVELLGDEEDPAYDPAIIHHMDKIVSAKPVGGASMFETGNAEEDRIIQIDEVIDVSTSMTSDGHFTWDPPPGNWIILRQGYTTTGARNAPATKAGTGLECDKMDTSALNLHFDSFPARLVEIAGPLAGNTFRYLFIDSWECGYQNWTGNFPVEFENRRGYSILPWIPAICGEIIGNNQVTEAFLHDFRLTIGELIEEYYYRHFSTLCEKNGLEFHAEVIYGGENYPPLKVMRTNQYVDLPMFEFWTNPGNDGFVRNNPVDITGYVTSAEAGHLYGKKIIPAEAYTGYAYYSETPWDLKPFGDRAFCQGINRMVLHSYVHQPVEKKPGMTLGWFANHFNRHNAWWPHLRGWTTFQSRVQYLLQQGEPVSDILYLVGDRMPQFQPGTDLYNVPPGYKIQPVNTDVLMNAAGKTENQIVLGSDQVFRLLIIPDDSVMNLETLEVIERLVNEGAVLIGPPPTTTLSLKNRQENSEKLQQLSAELWGDLSVENGHTDRTVGKGRVMWGESLGNMINKLGIQPDFEWASADPAKLIFIHKKIGNEDVYYVANQEDKSFVADCIFRISGKSPEIWNPQHGTVRKTALYQMENGRTRIPVSFGPRESLLFLFREAEPEEFITTVSSENRQIYPVKVAGSPAFIPEIDHTGSGYVLFSEESGQYTLQTSTGRSIEVKIPGSDKMTIRDEDMKLVFDLDTLNISSLGSWTDLENPAFKYFSGQATYRIDFTPPENWDIQEDSLFLSLGKIDATAKVNLNGRFIGTCWIPDFMIPVSGLLKSGKNVLEVEIANVYRNRIIGDLREYGKMENIWTTAPVQEFFNREMELRNSGLFGPVRMIRLNPVVISVRN